VKHQHDGETLAKATLQISSWMDWAGNGGVQTAKSGMRCIAADLPRDVSKGHRPKAAACHVLIAVRSQPEHQVHKDLSRNPVVQIAVLPRGVCEANAGRMVLADSKVGFDAHLTLDEPSPTVASRGSTVKRSTRTPIEDLCRCDRGCPTDRRRTRPLQFPHAQERTPIDALV